MNYDIETVEKYQEILGKLEQFVEPVIAGGAVALTGATTGDKVIITYQKIVGALAGA